MVHRVAKSRTRLSDRTELEDHYKAYFLRKHQVSGLRTAVLRGSLGFPGGSDGKESTCNAGDLGSTPKLGRSSGGQRGNPLQYSCLENPMDRGA